MGRFNIRNRLRKYAYSEEKPEIEEGDFESFINKYKETSDKVDNILLLGGNFDLIRETTSSLYMLSLQEKLEKSNKRLQRATEVLAIATLILVISNIWGTDLVKKFVEDKIPMLAKQFIISILALIFFAWCIYIIKIFSKYVLRRFLK